MSYNLIIDIGNSFVKITKFSSDKLIEQKRFGYDQADKIIHFTRDFNNYNCIISSVGKEDTEWLKSIYTKSNNCILFGPNTIIPIKNTYKTPKTLGYDRLAAAIGAFEVFKTSEILTIDAGTAITYDLIAEKEYKGGSISPGMNMRFRALNTFTRRLPEISYRETDEQTGKNTEESILSGVVLGIVHEMNGIIDHYKKKYPQIKTVITGGDADIFVKKIKNSIFAEPFLIAKGLNRILNYNVEKI